MFKLSSMILAIFCFVAVGCGSAKKKSSDTASNETIKEEKVGAKKSVPSQSSSGPTVTCTNDKDSRTLEVIEAKPQGCQLEYTKFSQKEIVATSVSNNEHCNTIRDRIRANLESSGFKCE